MKQSSDHTHRLYVGKILLLSTVVSVLTGGVAGGVVGFMAGNATSQHYGLQDSLYWLSGKNPKADMVENIAVVTEESRQIESATISAVESTTKSVVSVIVTKELQQRGLPNSFFPFDSFFDSPFYVPDEPTIQQVGGGTGFVIDAPEGLVLTNRHVVDDETAVYSVVLNDGTELEATVLARDPFNDLAVLKVAENTITAPSLTLGDSDTLRLGQTVIAIGNSLGEFSNTVTTGVVSGTERDIIAGSYGSSERLENVIQTDAAINPGNSGGPLINLQGEVIGINTAVSQLGQSIGFAIPINEAKQVVASVKEYGRIVRPYLGVRYSAVSPDIAAARSLPAGVGALLVAGQYAGDVAVLPGSPAEQAGLIAGDVIVQVGDQAVNEEQSLSYLIQQYQPGDSVDVTVVRENLERITLTIILKEFTQ